MSERSPQEAIENGDDLGTVPKVPLALGVYLLSDNMTLRDAWKSVNDYGPEETEK